MFPVYEQFFLHFSTIQIEYYYLYLKVSVEK